MDRHCVHALLSTLSGRKLGPRLARSGPPRAFDPYACLSREELADSDIGPTSEGVTIPPYANA